MLQFADKKKKNTSYEIKDKVFLLIKNIDTTRLLKKLNYKIIKSFQIIQKIEDSYELYLLKLMTRKHSVFHLLLLKKTEEDLLSEQI